MTSTLLERLHRLTALWGPAGREHKVAEALRAEIAPFVDEIRQDKFGNLIAIRRGQPGARRVMVSAHMDTIGAVAMGISDEGLITLQAVGGLKAYHAIGKRVVWGSGAVGILQHEPVDEAREVEFKKLWCDIGATSKEEALESVQYGDMCVLVGELQQMGDFITGPGLDNRTGCAVLLEVAQHLTGTEYEVAFAFTCQGEVGPRGAGAAAFGVNPDVAIVVDLCPAGDLPKGPKVDVKLGGGPAVKLKDGNYMAHQGLADTVRRIAGEHAIPVQTEIVASPGGFSDAQVISSAGQGIPTAILDIPARYLGTGSEMVALRDLHGTADLVIKLLQNPLD